MYIIYSSKFIYNLFAEKIPISIFGLISKNSSYFNKGLNTRLFEALVSYNIVIDNFKYFYEFVLQHNVLFRLGYKYIRTNSIYFKMLY